MENLLKYLLKNTGINHYSVKTSKNQTLFFEGDVCEKVGLIVHGKVSIISYYSDGEEVIYNTLKKGEMFGNNLIFSSEPYYRGDVVSIEESEILYINKEDLINALSSDRELLELYLKQQSDFSKLLNFKIKLLTIDKAKDRLVYYLTFNKKKVEYKSVTKLAKELYLSRETLSRTMYRMQSNDELEISNKIIILK